MVAWITEISSVSSPKGRQEAPRVRSLKQRGSQVLEKRRAIDARARQIVEESGVLWAVAHDQAKAEIGVQESSTVEETRPADDGYRDRVVVGCSFAALFAVFGAVAAVILLDSVWRGSDGCLGYGAFCSDRVNQAVLFGWGVLLAGFAVGWGLTWWMKQVWWSVLALLSIPVAWRVYEWWTAGRYL
jgi:hypothetical protein